MLSVSDSGTTQRLLDSDPLQPLPSDSDSAQRLHGDPLQPLPSTGYLAFRTFMFLLIGIVAGIVLFYFCGFGGKQTTALTDSFYFSSTTMTTTGYGDVVPKSVTSKIFTSVYIVFSAFIVNFFISPSFSRFVQSLEGSNLSRQKRIVYCVIHSVACMALGIPLFYCEKIGWGNTPYALIVSFSSTGIGDFAFSSVWGRIIGSVWLLICHLVNYRLGCLVFDEGDQLLVQDKRDAVQGESLPEAQNSTQGESLPEAQNSTQEANDALVKAAQNSAQEANDARVKAEEVAHQTLEALEQTKQILEEKSVELNQAKEIEKKKTAELFDALLEQDKARTEARAAQQLVSDKLTQISNLEQEKTQMMRELEDLRSKLGEKTVELRDAKFELKWLQHPN